MKELYIAPELEIMGFMAEERLASQTTGIVEFSEMPTGDVKSAVSPNRFDIDVPL